MTSRIFHRVTICLITALMLAGTVAEARPRGRVVRKPVTAPRSQEVVNINSASQDQLQFLPGIGPSKSRAIVRYRARRKFGSVYQITQVKGIGRKTYRKLRPHLTVKGPTTASGKIKLERQ